MNVSFENFTKLSSSQHELFVARHRALEQQSFGQGCSQLDAVNPGSNYATLIDDATSREYDVVHWRSRYGMMISCLLAVETRTTSLRHESYFLVSSLMPESYRAMGVACFGGHEGRSYLSQIKIEDVAPGHPLDALDLMKNFMEAGKAYHQSPPEVSGGLMTAADTGLVGTLVRHSMSYEANMAHDNAAVDFEAPNSLTHRLGSAILSQLHLECKARNESVLPVDSPNGMLSGYIVDDPKEGIIFAQRRRSQVTISQMLPPRLPDKNVYAQQYRIAPNATLFDVTPIELTDEEVRDFGVQVAMRHFVAGDQAYDDRPASEDPAPADVSQTAELNHMLMRILDGRMGTSSVSAQH